MKKLIQYILPAAVLVAGASCQKNFLDRYPETAISPNQFFNTEQDLSLYINGLVSLPGYYNYLADQRSDNMATTAASDFKTFLEGTPTPQNITDVWTTGQWSRLRDINYFLDNYSRAHVDTTTAYHFAGLARFYRAQFYYGMVQQFSDVPWYSHAISSPNDSSNYKPRDPRSLVVDSIMADLAFASTHVLTKQPDGTPIPTGTPNVWAIKLFYARVALYEGTWRKYHGELKLEGTAGNYFAIASAVCKDIMANSGYSIYNTGNPASDYATLFNSQDLTKNPEVIVPMVYDVSLKMSSGQNGGLQDYEQSPSRGLIQTYLMKDGTRFTDQAGYQQFGFVQEFQNRDPRLSQTIAYPGWVKIPDTKPYVQKLSSNFTGYHQIKGWINSTDGNMTGGADYPAYRYAEVLLTYAEAMAEQGNITQNDLDISVNLLRSRAGMPPMNLVALNAAPDSVLQKEYPSVSGANTGIVLEIRRERRVEFAMEGFRHDDIMRWDAAGVLLNVPQGIYFPGLGQFDLTGDGVPDIVLVDKNTPIPGTPANNSNGVPLQYYQCGTITDNVTVALQNGTAGGPTITENVTRHFNDPQYYYYPIPATQVLLNPALTQIFGWQ